MVSVWKWALTGFYLFKEMETEWVLLLRQSDETGIKILKFLSGYYKSSPLRTRNVCIKQ